MAVEPAQEQYDKVHNSQKSADQDLHRFQNRIYKGYAW